MFRFRMKSDTIQFLIMIAAWVTIAGSCLVYAQSHFASVESVDNVSKRVDTEVEERRELKAEVDGIYRLIVPRSAQIPIKHPGMDAQ
jgi:hypothetical protein